MVGQSCALTLASRTRRSWIVWVIKVAHEQDKTVVDGGLCTIGVSWWFAAGPGRLDVLPARVRPPTLDLREDVLGMRCHIQGRMFIHNVSIGAPRRKTRKYPHSS